MLSSLSIQRPSDFISIDVEGHEPEVLNRLSFSQWSPQAILLEDNSNYENSALSY